MIVRSAENSFHKGLAALHAGDNLEAMAYFEAAMRRDRETNGGRVNHRYHSYFALCMARVSRKHDDALRLCRQAAAAEFYSPEVFLNLGRVALMAGDRREAFDAFRRGLMLDSTHKELLLEMRMLGVRRSPLFPFLSRDHFLNRWAGRLRAQSQAA